MIKQRGGVLVTVCLSMVGMLALLALAVDVFRLLTSRIQMQNFTEYGTELVLEQIRNGALNGGANALDSATKTHLLTIINENFLFGEASTSSAFTAGDLCYNDSTCNKAVDILAGCYETPQYPATTPAPVFKFKVSSCASGGGVDRYSAVYIKMKSSGSGREFSLLFKGILTGFGGFSTDAFSYNQFPAGRVFVTGPYPKEVPKVGP